MSVYEFGSGVLLATPNSGTLAAKPTPMQFGTLQEVSLDISGEVKELFGRYQFPDDTRTAKRKITGKAKFGRFNGKLVNDLFFGGVITVGMVKVALDEPQTVPGSVSYVITVTNAANFVADFGVRYAATGKPLVMNATPAAGEYSVDTATGIYTFNVADKSVKMLITYSYKDTVNGMTTTVTNQIMGTQPKFEVFLNQPTDGNQSSVKLMRCTASKFTRATKLDDYTIPEFEFTASADDSGTAIIFYDPE